MSPLVSYSEDAGLDIEITSASSSDSLVIFEFLEDDKSSGIAGVTVNPKNTKQPIRFEPEIDEVASENHAEQPDPVVISNNN